MRIETNNLSYVYGQASKELSVHALSGVSLTIEEGEFYGIIGQTGSGKSTFVQHLNGLIKVGKNSGSVKVGEFDLADKKCDFKSLRSKVGMVFQYPEYQLFAETVYQDVIFGLNNFCSELSSEQKDARVKEAIELVGLDYESVKDKSPFELSGGQKRRVAIAGVIVSKPEILVLDEPVAGLDPIGKNEFMQLLHTLHERYVKTIIIVSHDMNLVAEHCTKLAVFSNGKVLTHGTPKQVFSQGDIIAQTGLELPVTAMLTLALNGTEEGFDNDFTVNGFTSVIAQKLGGGK